MIIGGGLTAARAVEGIREHDREGVIAVASAEQHLPYERPSLSKDVLLGKAEVDTAYPHPEGWYREQGVTLHLGRPAASVSADQRTVTLADGTELGWDDCCWRPVPWSGGSTCPALTSPASTTCGRWTTP